jgi:hypothetical protein
LTEQHRQDEDSYTEMLEGIRTNSVSEGHAERLHSRVEPAADDMKITHLYTNNRNVESYNLKQLGRLEAKEYTYTMSSEGAPGRVKALINGCLAQEILKLKVGARVMAIKNDQSGEREYVNGSIGEITAFELDTESHMEWPVVKFENGNTVTMYSDRWEMIEGREAVAAVKQVPLRLAWAVTVHKSQGMTLDSAHIDLSTAFEPGMGYVALSRLRAFDGVTLKGINEVALLVSPKALSYDQEFRTASATAEQMYG